MATQIQQLGGSTEQHSGFTGKDRVITINTDTHRVHVHDGKTPGGIPMARMSDLTTPGAGEVSYGNYGYDTVKDALNAALYKAPSITSFTNNVNTVEMGSTVTAVTLNWNCNKTPTKLTLDGTELDVTLKSQALTGLEIKANKSYTLVMTDENGATNSKSTGITFLNGVYFGVGNVDADGVTNEFVQSLQKSLTSSAKRDYTFNASAGNYCYIAFPARFGNATPNIGGFDGGMPILTTFDYTNPSGFTESYIVMRSSKAGLGQVTIKLK